MTKLYFINRFVLQWFFIRLTRNEERVIKKIRLVEFSQMLDGSFSMWVDYDEKDVDVMEWFSIQYWVIPRTGWETDFKYLKGGPKFLDITKKRKQCQ